MDKPTSSVAEDQVIPADPAKSDEEIKQDNPGETQGATDANTDSTQSSGVESEGANEPKTLEEVIKTAAERNKPKQETAQPAEEKVDETKPEGEEAAKADTEKPEEKVPFHNHPRWKELLQERDTFRERAERFDALTTYMQQNELTSEEVADGFEVMALMKSNPAEALKRLEEHASGLRQFLGVELPDDLKQKVESGYVDEDTAKELAAVRNQKALTEARLTLQEQRELERQQLQMEQSGRVEMATAVDAWIKGVQQRDPDYSVKEAFIVDRVQVLRMQNPPKTKEDAVALVQQAYSDATERLKALAPRRQEVRTTMSAASTTTSAKPEPKTLQEAIELSLRG